MASHSVGSQNGFCHCCGARWPTQHATEESVNTARSLCPMCNCTCSRDSAWSSRKTPLSRYYKPLWDYAERRSGEIALWSLGNCKTLTLHKWVMALQEMHAYLMVEEAVDSCNKESLKGKETMYLKFSIFAWCHFLQSTHIDCLERNIPRLQQRVMVWWNRKAGKTMIYLFHSVISHKSISMRRLFPAQW